MSGARKIGPVLLAGATATGKSEVAMALAGRLGGEIISVDSMQVYRGLDIGTAKPSAEEQRRVRHHLIDVAELGETFDAAQFARMAHAAVREIQSRGNTPILCGGTGLYFKAFMEGLGDAPAADAALRAELEGMELAVLLEELRRVDAATFDVIDKKNPRRVIRALEVIRLTGKPFSAQRAKWNDDTRAGDKTILYGLKREAADLHGRINARVERMFERGLLAEVGDLLKRGLAENKAAMQAIGYRQVVEHLRGERSLAETMELVKVRTRQFAKRQMTWFRRQANANWIECAAGDSAEAIAERIMKMAARDLRI